ncbi:TRAP transporter substrate-binding protein [Limihaloglobus sulfuriphilus]|nr:TRAP transporter substrate-binding protein [Limihaloglobus sulfuriphilus]
MKQIKTQLALMIILVILASVFFHFNYSKDSSATKILRIAHPLSDTHPLQKSLEYFARIVEQNSQHELTVEIYPNGQLGSDYQTIEQLQYGIIPMTIVSCGPLESFIPQMQIFGVPYLFRSREHMFKALSGPVGRELLETGLERGLKGLCFFDAGARSFYTSKTPIRSIDDLDGLKIRVMKTSMSIKSVQAMGGSPAPIDYGELYTALQQGVVDGAENNPPSFYTSMHYEICKYYTLDEHFRIPDILLISKLRWNRLSQEEQKIIADAAQQCSAYQQKVWAEFEEFSMEKLKSSGVEIISVNKMPFVQRVQPIWNQFTGTEIGTWVHRIQEIQ